MPVFDAESDFGLLKRHLLLFTQLPFPNQLLAYALCFFNREIKKKE